MSGDKLESINHGIPSTFLRDRLPYQYIGFVSTNTNNCQTNLDLLLPHLEKIVERVLLQKVYRELSERIFTLENEVINLKTKIIESTKSINLQENYFTCDSSWVEIK